jgi:hypothetical protein
MSDGVTVDGLSLLQRVALTSIVAAEIEGVTPVESLGIKDRVRKQLQNVDTELTGEPTERDVIRALNALGAHSYVNETQPSTSVTGKGRPQYELETDPAVVVDALRDDGRLEKLLENLEG